MEMIYKAHDRDLTISFKGEFDHHAASGAIASVEQWIEQNLPAKTVLDLEGLTFMDSSGIALLIRAKRRAELLGGSLSVANVPRQAARVLETAGLGRYFDLTSRGES